MKPYWVLIPVALLVGGCSDGSEGHPPPPPMSQAQVEQNIAKINGNSQLSDQQKQMAINGMKSAAEMQQRLAAQAKQGRPGNVPGR